MAETLLATNGSNGGVELQVSYFSLRTLMMLFSFTSLLGYKPGPRHRAARHAAGHHVSVQWVRRRGQRVRLQTGGRQRGSRGKGKLRFIFTLHTSRGDSFWISRFLGYWMEFSMFISDHFVSNLWIYWEYSKGVSVQPFILPFNKMPISQKLAHLTKTK